MTTLPPPIAVLGATGTGKSELALDLAEKLGGEIVNCDSYQQYRGMDIGTAKVPAGQRRGIPHHLLDVLDIEETATVADYQRRAVEVVEGIRARRRRPVIVGGSMMYAQSLLDEWEFPATDPEVRSRYEARLDEIGVRALHAELAAVDPEAARTILPTDPRRTVRALEVVELTGKPFAASKPQVGEPRWGTVILGLQCDTEILDRRLEARTDAMFAPRDPGDAEGALVAEVRELLARGLRDGETAVRAIGYAHVLAELDAAGDGELSPEAVERAREATFIATRRYVRRQRSWFGRDHRVRWIDTEDPATITAAAWAELDAAGAL